MKNLGKILLLLTMLANYLQAVTAHVTPKTVYAGDQISLILTAQGNEIKFPKLTKIAGFRVSSQSISRNITNINGKVTKTLSKEYIFRPQKSFHIPEIEVTVDGKSEMTPAMDVVVKKEKVGKEEAFKFEMKVDKKEAYVGEVVNVEFIFKKHKDIKLAEANFNSPTFHDFWAKPLKKQLATVEGDYLVYRIKYLLFPQKSGTITIEPGRMDAGIMQKRKRDYFNFERVKWKSIFTKEATLKVKPLPAGAEIYGNFEMSATVDKRRTKANEPVNLTITIKGIGNVDDIQEYKLDVKDAIVYADKPVRKIYTNNKEELGEFSQKFAIVSDRNFTIEPLKFTYFDSVTKKVKTLKSKPFAIEVVGNLIKTETAHLQKKSPSTQIPPKTKIVYDKVSMTKLILFTFGGFLLGALSMFLFTLPKREKREKSELSLAQKIKKSKSDKELLTLLIPHVDKSNKLKSIVKTLEEKIYEGKDTSIDRKKLAKHIEEYLKKKQDFEEILK